MPSTPLLMCGLHPRWLDMCCSGWCWVPDEVARAWAVLFFFLCTGLLGPQDLFWLCCLLPVGFPCEAQSAVIHYVL